MRKLKIILIILLAIIAYAKSVLASIPFSDNTKVHWRYSVLKNGKEQILQGKEINLAKKTTHEKLGISCDPPHLEVKKVRYGRPKGNTYSRDEERATLNCTINGMNLTSSPVFCAHSVAKNKYGAVYSDTTDYQFEKDAESFIVILSCMVK